MKKKLIIGGVIVAIVLILVLLILNSGKSKQNQIKTLVSPTPVDLINNQQYQDNPILQNYEALDGVETDAFIINYSTSQNKYIVTGKTSDTQEIFNQWLNENNYPELINNQDLVTFELNQGAGINSKIQDDKDFIFNLFSTLLNFNQKIKVNNQQLPTPKANEININNKNVPSEKKYYSQCGEYGNYSLPSGCTICKAGCGPTTIAMIGASYIDKTINPQTIVDLYKARGFLLGCDGSRYTDAKTAAESLGLKTTSFMIYSFETADQVASDFKNYIDDGWTIFALANYCQGGCGHFFWITEVDNSGNLWAYDPYYGRFSTPPFNENSKYPYPLYRVAFGVKK